MSLKLPRESSDLKGTSSAIDSMRPTATIADDRFAHPTPRTPKITAQLMYVRHPSERPISYMYDPPAGISKENCEYDMQHVLIEDARGFVSRTSVHREGFELWNAPSSISDFRDEEEVKRVYYLEAIELACAATGARYGLVFDHQLRKREEGRPPLTFGRYGDGSNPAAVGRVHNDYTEASGRRPLLAIPNDFPKRDIRNYGIVNIWRSIAEPILDTPLAVCDARSITVADLVPAEIRYQTRTGEIYLFTYSSEHSWYYFPEMNRDEALIIKQYDSQVSGVSRYTPHAAFDLPLIPPGTPLRQSIEVRCLVVYD